MIPPAEDDISLKMAIAASLGQTYELKASVPPPPPPVYGVGNHSGYVPGPGGRADEGRFGGAADNYPASSSSSESGHAIGSGGGNGSGSGGGGGSGGGVIGAKRKRDSICGACKQPGHVRSSKSCPEYHSEESRRRRDETKQKRDAKEAESVRSTWTYPESGPAWR